MIGFVDATFHFQLGHDTTNDGSFIRNGMMMDSVKFLLRKDLLWQLQESLDSGARTLLCSIVSFCWNNDEKGERNLLENIFWQLRISIRFTGSLKYTLSPLQFSVILKFPENVVPCELFVGHPAWSGVLRSVESSFPGGF